MTPRALKKALGVFNCLKAHHFQAVGFKVSTCRRAFFFHGSRLKGSASFSWEPLDPGSSKVLLGDGMFCLGGEGGGADGWDDPHDRKKKTLPLSLRSEYCNQWRSTLRAALMTWPTLMHAYPCVYLCVYLCALKLPASTTLLVCRLVLLQVPEHMAGSLKRILMVRRCRLTSA